MAPGYSSNDGSRSGCDKRKFRRSVCLVFRSFISMMDIILLTDIMDPIWAMHLLNLCAFDKKEHQVGLALDQESCCVVVRREEGIETWVHFWQSSPLDYFVQDRASLSCNECSGLFPLAVKTSNILAFQVLVMRHSKFFSEFFKNPKFGFKHF